jgi:hypothetical protein
MEENGHDLRLPRKLRAFYSSNVIEGGVCRQHGEATQGIGPLFGCDFCGGAFCPACTSGLFKLFDAGGRRYAWYCCPVCGIGLAFIGLPLLGAPSGFQTAIWEPEEPGFARNARVIIDPALREARPGAYRVLFESTIPHATREFHVPTQRHGAVA